MCSQIPTTRAKSPKLGTSRRGSGVGTGFGTDVAEVPNTRVSRSGRADPDHKSNGHSDDNKEASASKKNAVKKPGLVKALSDKTLRSSKSNGRLENPKAQPAPVSGTVKAGDAKDDNSDISVPDPAVQSKEAKTIGALIIDGDKDDAVAPVNESFVSDATSGTNAGDWPNGASSSEAASGTNGTVQIASGITENGDGSIITTSEKANRSAPVSEEVKEKVVKAKREKLKASTPILSSAAKREAAIKHGAKSNTDLVSSIGDVAVAS